MPAVATIVVIGAVIAVTLSQLHVNLLLSNTTVTGGDTGAHVMMPAYLQTLLSHGQVTGWDPSWYDGYPIYVYYFVLPDLLAAAGGWIIHYDVAFKLVTILGSVTLPVAAWACGRLFRLRAPGPALLAAATLPFLFDYTFTIYGGNLFSTLAGEYAYSLSISVALVFLGLMAQGLRTGRHRGWAAVALAACILCHIVPAMFAIAGAAVLMLFELLPVRRRLHEEGRAGVAARWQPDGVLSWRRAVWFAVSTVALGVLLSGWWLVPFGIRQPYATAMGYENVTTFRAIFLPEADWWALLLAAVAVVVAVRRRSRFGLFVSVMGGISALAVVVDPQGSLYNVRALPLWFLCVYMADGWVFAVGAGALARYWRRRRMASWVRSLDAGPATGARPRRRPGPAHWAPGAVGGALAGLAGVCLVVVPPFVLPATSLPVQVGANEVSGWAAWNYSGYQGKPAYPEYRGVVHMMASVGRRYGCGRAMWEYSPDLNRFGTPESLMLLPYWTDRCIDSMEGLLFESSATTPYHFLNQAELSETPSDPMVGLPYGAVDVPLGIEHLQLLGVRYFMASSPEVEAAAARDPSLHLIARSGPWHSLYGSSYVNTTWDVYLVSDSAPVSALSAEPAVLTGVRASQSSWLGPSVAWYDEPTRWQVELAAGGPASWPRVQAGQRPPVVPVKATTVSHITEGDQSITFDVSHPGTPVLVKTSYFPNWEASGARGPWRVTPNLMVVVPTGHHVVLTYGTTHANLAGLACTGAGVVVLVVWAVAPRVRRRRARRSAADPRLA